MYAQEMLRAFVSHHRDCLVTSNTARLTGSDTHASGRTRRADQNQSDHRSTLRLEVFDVVVQWSEQHDANRVQCRGGHRPDDQALEYADQSTVQIVCSLVALARHKVFDGNGE